MITITKTPGVVSLARNPVKYTVHSDNQYEDEGAVAVLTLVVDDTDGTAGHQIKMVYGNNVFYFVLAGTPDESGFQLRTAGHGDDYDSWGTKIFEDFCKNYDLMRDFLITTEPGTGVRYIIFTARIRSSLYTIATSNNTIDGLSQQSSTAGEDPILRSNFGIKAVLIDRTNVPSTGEVIFAEDFLPVDNEGNAYFDIAEFLQSMLEAENEVAPRFTFPKDTDLTITLEAYMFAYKVGFAEQYGGTCQKIHYDTERHSIDGGVPRKDLILLEQANKEYFEYDDNAEKWLTWAPNSVKISANMPFRLYYFFNLDDSLLEFVFKAKVYYGDNEDDEIVVVDNLTERNRAVWEFICGPAELDLFSTYTDLIRYEVWLEDSLGDPITDKKEFIIDTGYFKNERLFLFRNSFSAYDIVRMTGLREDETQYDRTLVEFIEEYTPTDKNPPRRQLRSIESETYKANSGWVSREIKDYLREFLLSEEVYEIVNNRLFRCLITQKSVKLFTDKELSYSLEFEYERSYTNTHYGLLEPEED